jgi:hypothetical protein
VEDGPPRLEIEALDVDQPPIAGRHQDGQPAGPCLLPDEGLDVEGVAFLDHDVEALEENAHGGGCHAGRHGADCQIGIKLGDSACGHRRLVDAQIEDAAWHPVEVG